MDTPIPPSENLPPTTPVSPPVSPSPAITPAISGAVKTAGFFTGKVIAAIAGIVVVGGGIGVGYFVFPEPFYNTVGKYIGLPAPVAMEERAAGEENSAKETDGDAVGLFDALPGSDANYVTYFQKTDEAASVIDELVKGAGGFKNTLEKLQGLKFNGTGTETMPGEQTLISAASGINQVLVVAKIDYDAVKNKRGLNTNPFESGLPFAAALKIPAEKEAAFLEAVKTLQSLEKNGEENPFKKISVEGKGNGIVVITNPSHPLDGKFSDNPLKAAAEKTAADTNVLIAFDLRAIVEKAVRETEEEINKKPEVIGGELKLEQEKQQLELLKKAQNLVLAGALKKENGKANLKINMRIGMTDQEGAQKTLELIKPQMDQLNFFIPPDYQEFLKTNLSAEENELALDLTVENLGALEQKILTALDEASRRPLEIGKPFNDESPADLPNLNQPDPSVLDGKIRRKKN